MNATRAWLCGVALGAVVGCASAPRVPAELANARTAYRQASHSCAVTLAPLDLEAARAALQAAEQAYAAQDLDVTRDLAYVAARKAELAEARALETQDLTDAPATTVAR